MERIEVKIREIVPNPDSSGDFRLLLEDVADGREVPIIISGTDVRPLTEGLNGTKHFRPRTHDLFAHFLSVTHYTLRQVDIHTFRRGVFYCSLSFFHPEEGVIEIDCRPTDAIALAMRTKSPVYVSGEVIRQVGSLNNDTDRLKLPQRLRALEEKLLRLVDEERYEEACVLRDKINTLKSKNR